jgi:hypothetical protein
MILRSSHYEGNDRGVASRARELASSSRASAARCHPERAERVEGSAPSRPTVAGIRSAGETRIDGPSAHRFSDAVSTDARSLRERWSRRHTVALDPRSTRARLALDSRSTRARLALDSRSTRARPARSRRRSTAAVPHGARHEQFALALALLRRCLARAGRVSTSSAHATRAQNNQLPQAAGARRNSPATPQILSADCRRGPGAVRSSPDHAVPPRLRVPPRDNCCDSAFTVFFDACSAR